MISSNIIGSGNEPSLGCETQGFDTRIMVGGARIGESCAALFGYGRLLKDCALRVLFLVVVG